MNYADVTNINTNTKKAFRDVKRDVGRISRVQAVFLRVKRVVPVKDSYSQMVAREGQVKNIFVETGA